MSRLISLGVLILASASTLDADRLYGSKGQSIARAWISYSSNRPAFPQCCKIQDGPGCSMVRISDDVHDRVIKKGSEKFTTGSGESVFLQRGTSGLSGRYTDSNNVKYRVVAPSNKDKKQQPCKSARVPPSQAGFYYKIVPVQEGRGYNHPGVNDPGNSSDESDDSGDSENQDADAAAEEPTTEAPVEPTIISDWGECQLLDEYSMRHRTCLGPACDGVVIEQFCVDAEWSEWSTCIAADNSSRTRNNCEEVGADDFCCNVGVEDTRECVIAGVLGEWEAWSACSLTSLTRDRYKSCDNPDDLSQEEVGDRIVECETVYQTEVCMASNLACATVEELTSPGYPANYTSNLSSVQFIRGGDNSNLHIKLTNMDLEAGPNCQYDSLVIREAATKKVLLGKTCGQDLRSFVTTTNEVEVIFTTDGSQVGSGWRLVWCATQVVQSPNFGAQYPNNVDTSQKIQVSDGSIIKMEFSFLDIEDGLDCKYDWVQICHDSLGKDCFDKICGNTLPAQPFESKSSLAYVFFHSDGFGNRGGFQLSWVELDDLLALAAHAVH